MAMHPSEDILYSTGVSNYVNIWDISLGEHILLNSNPARRVDETAIAEDGSILYTSASGMLSDWDFETSALIV